MKDMTYIKGNYNKGGIFQNGEKCFIAVTMVSTKDFKSLKGAQKYMTKFGYVEA